MDKIKCHFTSSFSKLDSVNNILCIYDDDNNNNNNFYF